ncbi:MAG: dTDP-4-dehydrorhamnose reductase [Flavobacteriaceae bacterium]
MNVKKVLVTGAEGQLGKCLKDVSSKYPQIHFDFKNRSELDITNASQVADVFSASNYNFCINTAAYTNVEQAERSPELAYLVNEHGVKNLAMQASQKGVTLVHISTDYVFDGEKEEPYLPSDEANPINEYGKSKLAGELQIQKLLETFYIIRTSWLYSEYGHNFYKTILRKARHGETLYVTDEQVGCPTHAANLAQYIMDLLTGPHRAFGIIHYTDGVPMSWYQFAALILKENGLDEKIALVKDTNYRTFARRPRNSILKSEDF